MDYRSLVHEKDETVYSEIKVIVMDIRGFYVSQTNLKLFDQPPVTEENFKPSFYTFLPQAELYDIISKNLEKVTNPKGEEKPSMY